MRQRYNNYRIVNEEQAWFPAVKKVPRFKYYPMVVTVLAAASITYILRPVYTGIEDWPSIVEDRRILRQRKRIFEMLVLTPTRPKEME